MKVEIDLEQLVIDSATLIMDKRYASEKSCIGEALTKQLPEDFGLYRLVRKQVKEYKSLTMWRE